MDSKLLIRPSLQSRFTVQLSVKAILKELTDAPVRPVDSQLHTVFSYLKLELSAQVSVGMLLVLSRGYLPSLMFPQIRPTPL